MLLAFRNGNPPFTGGFPTQMASYAENVSMLWCSHDTHSGMQQPAYQYLHDIVHVYIASVVAYLFIYEQQ